MSILRSDIYRQRVPSSMKKKDLEMALEKVPPFTDPVPSLEQYPTSATIAADIVFDAYSNGDIAGMKILDLGCGTGIFSIAAWMIGAGAVVGYDISENALSVARTYAESIGASVEYKQSDIQNVNEGADTVLMNPPFGSQKKNADRPFLDKAMECADRVYSIHMANTLDFLKEYSEEKGRRVVQYKVYKYSIPHTFSFHTKTKQAVDVVAVLIE